MNFARRKNDGNQDNCDCGTDCCWKEAPALAIDSAQAFNGERIISGDGQAGLPQMNIGQPGDNRKQKTALYHLIVCGGNRSYSAFDFNKRSQDTIEDITARGKLPISLQVGQRCYIKSSKVII